MVIENEKYVGQALALALAKYRTEYNKIKAILNMDELYLEKEWGVR